MKDKFDYTKLRAQKRNDTTVLNICIIGSLLSSTAMFILLRGGNQLRVITVLTRVLYQTNFKKIIPKTNKGNR